MLSFVGKKIFILATTKMMNIPLPEAMKSFVEERSAGDGYGNTAFEPSNIRIGDTTFSCRVTDSVLFS